MTKTINFVISLLVFSLLAVLLAPAGSVHALSIDPNYFYQEACPILSTKDLRTYGPGARGDFVTALQQFLSVEGAYSYGMGPMSWAEFTGYYGPATTQAVQDWQSANTIVSSGSVYTTGYGYVGPQTRAAIANRCGEKLRDIPKPPSYPSSYNGEIRATKSYQDGTYTINGTVELPNGCYDAEFEGVTIQESYPEMVTLNFTVRDNSSDDVMCTMAIEYYEFETSFSASEKAEIRATINGQLAIFDLENNIGAIKVGDNNYLNKAFPFNEITTIDQKVVLYNDPPDTDTDNEYPEAVGGYVLSISPARLDYRGDEINTEVSLLQSDYITTWNVSPWQMKLFSRDGHKFAVIVLSENTDQKQSQVLVLYANSN